MGETTAQRYNRRMNDIFDKSRQFNVVRDVASEKKKLIIEAKKKGIYENFGQTEVRKLQDRYGYTKEVEEFDNWAMNFDQRKLAKVV
jgi:hypothetical protein